MPGAQLTGHEGDDYLGKVKVKVGPVTSEFSGKVRFVELDRDGKKIWHYTGDTRVTRAYRR